MGNPRAPGQNLLIFHLSGLDCAFPLEAVREIVPAARLSSPPSMPLGLAGILNLRGTAVPIVRLDRLFNLPEQQAGLHTPMIVLRGVMGPIGILVNSVRGIVEVTPSRLLALPDSSTFQACAAGVLELDGDLVHLLSPVALLRVNEDQMIADYSGMSQARLLLLEERT
jgi:purine-binding chemotaxis protein CheW